MTTRRGNQGCEGLGLGAAMHWFAANDYGVAVPISEGASYDLIVDDGERLLRVEVLTATRRGRHGVYEVDVRVANNGHRPRDDPDPFARADLLFVLADDGMIHVVPGEVVTGSRVLTLDEAFVACRKPPGTRGNPAGPAAGGGSQENVVGEGFEPS